ncbi:MAG TPA: hypothetical protein VIT65_07540 [Microlunatus sp.]
MSTDITITPMYVTDQDVAPAFYCDKLGFVLDTDADTGSMRRLTVRLPAAPQRGPVAADRGRDRHRLTGDRRPAARAHGARPHELDDPGLRRRARRPGAAGSGRGRGHPGADRPAVRHGHPRSTLRSGRQLRSHPTFLVGYLATALAVSKSVGTDAT